MDEDKRNTFRSIEWVSAVLFGVGVVFSLAQLAMNDADGGEWLALVLTSIGFVCSLVLAVANFRGGHDN